MVSVSVIHFVSHTFDLNTCCMYRERHPGCLRKSELEAQVYIQSNSHC